MIFSFFKKKREKEEIVATTTEQPKHQVVIALVDQAELNNLIEENKSLREILDKRRAKANESQTRFRERKRRSEAQKLAHKRKKIRIKQAIKK